MDEAKSSCGEGVGMSLSPDHRINLRRHNKIPHSGQISNALSWPESRIKIYVGGKCKIIPLETGDVEA